MKAVLTFVIAMLALTGCSALASDEGNQLKRFKTKEDSIEHGIKEEEISQEDIIGEIEENGETIIFYKRKAKEGIVIEVSSISKNEGKYAWYRADAGVLVKYNSHPEKATKISLETQTQSGKKFIAYTGYTKEQNPTIDTENGSTTPHIDKNSGIYFYIESIK
ncbi:hypothetical protein [Metabacillus dongyingensis]|uniref:hypothetical protein n=1 Tax=Metabacillus dongyingensis TaxID=2874282 RepID=UPI001CBFD546|nr:hypothetical protein [Metabacillus dongyingensis]UAL52856.1 hypothetical protein K8L98_03200 [Metabacillus dongyingensis]